MNFVRTSVWLLAVLLFCSPGSVEGQASTDFPFSAIVAKDKARAYSGPGKAHYATDELPLGAVVEVWRFDPGGWCAIRPVEGSFCLVPAAAIEKVEAGLGRTREADLQVWVGTRLGPVENPLWQVKLKKHEEVEILGEANWPSPEGFSTTWFQIRPPAGEFRWIEREALQIADKATGLPKPDAVAQVDRPEGPQSIVLDRNVQPATWASQEPDTIDDPFAGLSVPLAKRNEVPAPELRSGAGNADSGAQFDILESELGVGTTESRVLAGQSLGEVGWRPARAPVRLASADTAFGAPGSVNPGFGSQNQMGNSKPVSSGSLSGSNSGPSALAGQRDWPERIAPDSRTSAMRGQEYKDGGQNLDELMSRFKTNSPTVATWGNQPLPSELAELDLQIASEIVKPAEYWDLDRLAGEALRFQSVASTDAEREQTSKLLRKVEDLRRTRTSMLGSQTTQTPAAVASRGRPTGSGLDTTIELDATYDAHGWLNELVQDNGSMEPTYVLQDSTGKITHQITPAPGLNLRRYLKAQIGVMGQRGFNQRLKLSHVEAERVIVLETARENSARRF